ncbi:MAG: saccharopine dehydrogenase NADP-binding domain-containing protein [Acidobacteria bacterium]|nr:saccharopine dehydrogenase NADP-binding domain-containing protein [Acidobacteriota bacterium]
MKQILVLGAGRSAPFLIKYLLDNAEEHDWFVTVGDLSLEAAERAVARHPRSNAIPFDVNDVDMRNGAISNADIVVNLLAPVFQPMIANDCLVHRKHMVSASYCNPQVRDLHTDALRHGVLILTEMGLDPGIDHMSAMHLIEGIHARGGKIKKFCSYGGGLPAPGAVDNPLQYAITWNPRNVVMSGSDGAIFLEDGRLKIIPHHRLFTQTWPVDVMGLGMMEGYANRDSVTYQHTFGLEDVETLIRGTLRYPGFCETWSQIVKLGLPNETLSIPNLKDLSMYDLVSMFTPKHSGGSLEQRVASYLNINPTGAVMQKLKWLGLFSNESLGANGNTSTHMMVELLNQKLVMPQGARDMVILVHEMEVTYEHGPNEKITSTLIEYGEPGGITAMAKTVGMPLGIAVKLILNQELPLTGVQIPTHPAIYKPILSELASEGLAFQDVIEH